MSLPRVPHALCVSRSAAAACAALFVSALAACSRTSQAIPAAQAAPAAAPPAPAAPRRELSESEARRILPRAALEGLSGEQRAQFLEVAGDTFDYAGCKDTLAKCLGEGVSDVHALRMADLVKALILDGLTTSRIIETVESYYASFDVAKRQKLRDEDCPILGDPKAKVAVVEYSDYQCPHCASAAKPLHDLVMQAEKGKARLCSKHFPLPGHPRAAIAAGCAEFARRKGKFWPMSGLLFAHQEELEDEQLKGCAQQLGLDGEQMLKEVYAGKFDAVIERHRAEGLAAQVMATPTIFMNGRHYRLPLRLDYLRRSVEDEEEWQLAKAFLYVASDKKG